MRLLLDTNVLLRLAQVASPDHSAAKGAVLQLADDGHQLCLVPQVVYEFWVVATRPVEVNGLGMDPETAEKSLEGLARDYILLRDERGIFDRWRSLIRTYDVLGKNAHDARLVAAMLRHGLTHLITFNTADFVRYSGVVAHAPAAILAGQLAAVRSS